MSREDVFAWTVKRIDELWRIPKITVCYSREKTEMFLGKNTALMEMVQKEQKFWVDPECANIAFSLRRRDSNVQEKSLRAGSSISISERGYSMRYAVIRLTLIIK